MTASCLAVDENLHHQFDHLQKLATKMCPHPPCIKLSTKTIRKKKLHHGMFKILRRVEKNIRIALFREVLHTSVEVFMSSFHHQTAQLLCLVVSKMYEA